MRRLIFTGFLFLLCAAAFGQVNNLSPMIAALHGTYKHFMPCDNCTGIETTLTLDCEGPCNSGKFSLIEASVNSINGDKGSESMGTWTISDTLATPTKTSLVISLRDTILNDKTSNYFLFTEGSLEQLKRNKQRVDTPFTLVLKKLDNSAILDLR